MRGELMNVIFVMRLLRERKVKIALKDIHVGGKLIDSNYCDKKFYTQEKFAEGQTI